MSETNEVIIFNKHFLGDWLNDEFNIGHEIIDFFTTDKGECYAYNNPWGVCPTDVWVDGTTRLIRKKCEKYVAKYLVLCSEYSGKIFNIDYVLELAEKLHRNTGVKRKPSETDYEFSCRKEEQLRPRQKEVKAIIDERNICYNSKKLYDIYKNDDSLFVTFRVQKVYKAVKTITVCPEVYNLQRNKGYLYSDGKNEKNKKNFTKEQKEELRNKLKRDYLLVKQLVQSKIVDGDLAEIDMEKLSQNFGGYKKEKTFMSLSGIEGHEQAYTDILWSLLSYDNKIFNLFCKEYNDASKNVFIEGAFNVFRETKIVEGRMDICADSPRQRIVMENKVYSGLNGLKPRDNKTQLSTYWNNWAKTADREKPIIFITCPDFRIEAIKQEILLHDVEMQGVCQFIPYSKIAKFIENNKSMFANYRYNYLLDDIIKSFSNLSYKTLIQFYGSKFYEKTL